MTSSSWNSSKLLKNVITDFQWCFYTNFSMSIFPLGTSVSSGPMPKVLSRSTCILSAISFTPTGPVILSVKEIHLVWHNLFLRNPCWLFLIGLFSSRCFLILSWFRYLWIPRLGYLLYNPFDSCSCFYLQPSLIWKSWFLSFLFSCIFLYLPQHTIFRDCFGHSEFIWILPTGTCNLKIYSC